MFRFTFIEEENKETIVPLLSKLNDTISVETLKGRLDEMFLSGYKCVGIYDDAKLIGISGLWVLTKYYIGKHIEPDNVYILPEYQGNGLGKKLLDWIFEYSKTIGCVGSELNCYVDNKAGQRFWESQGYEMVGYHYQKRF